MLSKNEYQRFRLAIISSGAFYNEWGAVYDGLAKCCQSPRILKLITNGIRTEKCGNCGAEANVE